MDIKRTPDGKHVFVTFKWSTEYGECYECGLPAAFYTTDAYDRPDEPPKPLGDEHKRCAVCAANDASTGLTIIRIDSTRTGE